MLKFSEYITEASWQTKAGFREHNLQGEVHTEGEKEPVKFRIAIRSHGLKNIDQTSIKTAHPKFTSGQVKAIQRHLKAHGEKLQPDESLPKNTEGTYNVAHNPQGPEENHHVKIFSHYPAEY